MVMALLVAVVAEIQVANIWPATVTEGALTDSLTCSDMHLLYPKGAEAPYRAAAVTGAPMSRLRVAPGTALLTTCQWHEARYEPDADWPTMTV